MAERVTAQAGDKEQEPAFSVFVLENRFRDGSSPKPCTQTGIGELFKNAPAVKGDFFKVATIIE
jgi:aspartyl-tRNA synthetase